MSVYHLLLALHLVFAVFAVGPLVHAATTAGRGIRTGDGRATASAARVLRLYAYVSVVVVAVGVALMYRHRPGVSSFDEQDGILYGSPRPNTDYLPTDGGTRHIGEFDQTWIWLSLVLYVIAIGLVFAVIVPTLDRASARIEQEESVVALTPRVAAAGGVVGLLFAAIVVLMVYRPGQ